MACASNRYLRRTELETEPILPEGYGLLKAFRAVLDVLQDASELQREMEKRYRTSRW